MNTYAVIVAAGRGTRAGLGVNKAFAPIDGRSVLKRTLDAFENAGLYDGIALVLSREDLPLWEELKAKEGDCPLVKRIAFGGDTRTQSVFNGLSALPDTAELVSIHDAARPFVTAKIMAATLESARAYGSGVISTRVTDTIKRVDETGAHSLPREALRAVQTPQTFRFAEILSAHRLAAGDGFRGTDDAELYERYIGPVHLVETNDARENIKLTNREDFMRYSDETAAPLIGYGYDAHRLKEGRALVLCGVDVPHSRGLDGHSDADVAVHALMDALLGALGEGDIGRWFPDNDPRYEGISSMRLLAEVMDAVRARGLRVGNADVTITAQKPKLMPHIDRMRDNLRAALNTPHVNVKATTTERMGFEGREEGISAAAVALLLPQ